MNSRKTFTIIMAISLILGGYRSFAQTAEELFPKAIQLEEVKGELEKAIEVYRTIVTQFPANRPVASKAQLHIGLCYEKLGNKEARKAYENVVRDYADQEEPTKVAKERLSALSIAGEANNGRTEISMRRISVFGGNPPEGISSDGRYVFYRSNGTGDLWYRDLQSSEQKRITREGSWLDWTYTYGYTTMSPDGKQIAYTWCIRDYEELRLSAIDGSSMRILHSSQEGRRRMYVRAWMPDGRQILAFSLDAKDNYWRRHIISLPEGTIRDIGQPVLNNEISGLDWGFPSPDGRYIAYSLKGDIYIYDTTTGQDLVLVQTQNVADNVVGWIPNGSGILFVSDRSGNNDLYLLEIENGQPRGGPELLRGNLVASKSLFLTRDGRLFQFKNTGTIKSFITQVEDQSGRLIGRQTLVDSNYPDVEGPGWSSDGKMLYYEVFKDPANEQFLFIRSEATGQTREIALKPKLEFWYNPVLSPDGRKFAVAGRGENMNFGIFAIDPESGDVSQLAKIPTENDPVDPCQNWSPDSKVIYYKVRSPEQSEEFIIRCKNLTTGEEKDIHRGIHTRDMKISPDGTRLVYFRNDRPTKSYVLGILDIQSGKELDLWRVSEADVPGGISGPIWVPDGSHVLVAVSLKEGSELWRFPVAGGPGEKFHFFTEDSWGFVFHPSGKRMAFIQGEMNFELWVLENFLPK